MIDELTSTPRPLGNGRQLERFRRAGRRRLDCPCRILPHHAVEFRRRRLDLSRRGRSARPFPVISSSPLTHAFRTAWYRPVQGIQYLIEYGLFGSDPLGYHVANVLLHLVNCLLLYGIVVHITGRKRTGAVAALLFASFRSRSRRFSSPA